MISDPKMRSLVILHLLSIIIFSLMPLTASEIDKSSMNYFGLIPNGTSRFQESYRETISVSIIAISYNKLKRRYK